jgi:hypothetical protein
MTVLLDMANSNGHLHGGCTAMLIDKHVSSTRVQLQLINDTVVPRFPFMSLGLRQVPFIPVEAVYHSL